MLNQETNGECHSPDQRLRLKSTQLGNLKVLNLHKHFTHDAQLNLLLMGFLYLPFFFNAVTSWNPVATLLI